MAPSLAEPPFIVGLVALLIMADGSAARARDVGPPQLLSPAPAALASDPQTHPLGVAPSAFDQAQADRSAVRTIALHTLVGTGAGVLIGLALQGADVAGDGKAVVLSWTALGSAAGLVRGVVTSLLD